MHVYATPHGSTLLPLELLSLIVSFVSHPHPSTDPSTRLSTLLSLSLSSHRLRALTLPHLFHSFSISAYSHDDYEQLKPFHPFFKSLLTSDSRALHLGTHIKSLRLQFSYETIPGDSEWPSFRRMLTNYLKALALLPNLTNLVFVDTPVAPDLLSEILRRTKVRSLTLSGCVASIEPTGSGYSVIIDDSGLRQLANVLINALPPHLSIQSEIWTLLHSSFLSQFASSSSSSSSSIASIASASSEDSDSSDEHQNHIDQNGDEIENGATPTPTQITPNPTQLVSSTRLISHSTHPPSNLNSTRHQLTHLHLSTCQDASLLRSFLISSPSLQHLSVSQITSTPLYESGLDLPNTALPQLSHVQLPAQWIPQLLLDESLDSPSEEGSASASVSASTRPIKHLDLRPRLRNGLDIVPFQTSIDALLNALKIRSEANTNASDGAQGATTKITELCVPYGLACVPWGPYLPHLESLEVCLADADILGNDSSQEILDFFIRFVQDIGQGQTDTNTNNVDEPEPNTNTNKDANANSGVKIQFEHLHTLSVHYPNYRRRLYLSFLIDLQSQHTILQSLSSSETIQNSTTRTKFPKLTMTTLSSLLTWSRSTPEDSWSVYINGVSRQELKRSIPRFLSSGTWRVTDWNGCLRGLFEGEGEEVPSALLVKDKDENCAAKSLI